ncbi:class I SAM-dependent methyltransferase [Salinimicrobium sp. TH3]|uniref:class I SAM-dependent methyltransferase n=1 Tax=Salinimicrobium sp. TH3 TaxID=2997342 RepID=UPI002274943F|nr:class I SAM-dependent methyltransferase [Salinimicrobium sp. TH3]MCY2688679.1 class I SAM-dependent methyltransferase [Salinimicrobium sp. TH3]
MNENQQHWDKVYSEKAPTEVSWYEPMPEISLNLIKECNLEKDAAIIDIGGGDSFLAEFLVSKDYTDVTVVDISKNAIQRAKERMCEKADKVTWIVADAANFKPNKKFDLWHDRAAFHFLTNEEQRENYLKTLFESIKPGGYVILSTFSDKGPPTCSGLPVQRYSVGDMQKLFEEEFSVLSGRSLDHTTPSGKTQNFTVCSFQKKK